MAQRVVEVLIHSGDLVLFAPGDAFLITATAMDPNGYPVADATVEWTLADANVARIDGDSLFAVSIGTTVLVARSGPAADTVPVWVAESGTGEWYPPCTSSSGGDSFEPDNCPADATLLQDPDETDGEFSAGQEHSFHAVGDHDWVTFEVTVASDVCVYASRQRGPHLAMRLYSLSGHLLDESSAGFRTTGVCRTNVPAGTYFGEIFDIGDNETLESYAIQVMIRRIGTISGLADSFEPDDRLTDATLLQDPDETDEEFSAPQEHSIYGVGDHDWVKFNVTVASDICVHATRQSGPFLTMRLYDSSGQLLDESDNEFHTIGACRTNAAAGTYFGEVFDTGDNETVGSYTVQTRIRRVGTITGLADGFEPDDQPAEATLLQDPIETDLEFSNAQEHSIYGVGDHDWVKFDVTVASDICVQADRPSGPFLTVRLYDSSGHLLDESDNEFHTIEACRANVAAGTYFGEVFDTKENETLASYTVRTRVVRR